MLLWIVGSVLAGVRIDVYYVNLLAWYMSNRWKAFVDQGKKIAYGAAYLRVSSLLFSLSINTFLLFAKLCLSVI